MPVRPIEFGSADYEAACVLRRRFLREPLGLELTAEDVAGEELQHHFGCFDEAGRLLGAAIGKPDAGDPRVVRIRQVVIDEDRRGAGLGRELMTGLERRLAELGFVEAVLYARDEACPFYARCGYDHTGATAELIGLTHREMRKPLAVGA